MGSCQSIESTENQSSSALETTKPTQQSSQNKLQENTRKKDENKNNIYVQSSNKDDDDNVTNGTTSSTRSIGRCKAEIEDDGWSSHSNHSRRSIEDSRSISSVGLVDIIENRKGEGTLTSNVVHIEVPFGKRIEEVYDGVHTGDELGDGVSGIVRKVTHRATGMQYAVKCIKLDDLETEESLEQLRQEICIMCELDHPNIVRLEEVYESTNEIYLVQELCNGGQLFDGLDKQSDEHYTEQQCARLVKQMLCAVRYIHSKGIIHRDLKLENFLFTTDEANAELKMIDFGLSKHFKYDEVHHERVGTPYTVAPEVILGNYDERCDIWAIGVITYLLLSGEAPFGGCEGPDEPLGPVRCKILEGSFSFDPPEIWDNVSNDAKSFINSLLVTDPNQRPTALEARNSTWLKTWTRQEPRNNDENTISANVVNALVTFEDYSDLRKILCEVISFTLIPDQIQELRREFDKIDVNGSGEISFDTFEIVLLESAAESGSALTEDKVKDIFNAMRVRKSETKVHWHEFIAAGLSECKVDDRNLRLAFDRLDKNHKGYINFDDVLDIMGSDVHSEKTEEAYRKIFIDGLKDLKSKDSILTYEDFLLLMKGQTKE